jgi:hypothetical protein
MLRACFVTLLVLTVSAWAVAAPAERPVRAERHAPHARKAPAKPAPGRDFTSDQLFSLRERRRIAAYLRMRLLEMREAGLERAAEAVKRRLPAGALFEGSARCAAGPGP